MMTSHSGSPELGGAIEIAIVGGGPAGLTAGMYAARARRKVVLFEPGMIGGQIASAG